MKVFMDRKQNGQNIFTGFITSVVNLLLNAAAYI